MNITKEVVGVNEKGLRVGQYHQRAKISDQAVDLIRDLYAGGMTRRELAAKFEVSRPLVDKIVNYKLRVQRPVRFVAV